MAGFQINLQYKEFLANAKEKSFEFLIQNRKLILIVGVSVIFLSLYYMLFINRYLNCSAQETLKINGMQANIKKLSPKLNSGRLVNKEYKDYCDYFGLFNEKQYTEKFNIIKKLSFDVAKNRDVEISEFEIFEKKNLKHSFLLRFKIKVSGDWKNIATMIYDFESASDPINISRLNLSSDKSSAVSGVIVLDRLYLKG